MTSYMTIVINRLIELQVDFQQYMLLEAIYKRDSEDTLKLVARFKETFMTKTLLIKEAKDELIVKGLLIRTDNEETLHSYQLTDKFLDYFVDKYKAGDELWDAYPPHYYDNGKVFPLALMDKEEFYELYWTAINEDRREHEQVMKDLEYADRNGYINFKLEKFVRSRNWTAFRKLRGADDQEDTNVKQHYKDY